MANVTDEASANVQDETGAAVLDEVGGTKISEFEGPTWRGTWRGSDYHNGRLQ